MKKYFHLFLLIICVTVVFSACKKCHTTEFPEKVNYISPTSEDLTWINHFNDDTIVFKSNTGVFDSIQLLVGSELISRDLHAGAFNSCDEIDIPEFLAMSYNFINNDTTLSFATITSPNSESNLHPMIYSNKLRFPSEIWIKGSTSTVTIGGVSYNDVYVFDGDSTLNSNGDYFRIFYQRQNGLLRYDEMGGLKWEKVN